jgi:5-methylcytosine-specific restriction endonuclease McrA
MALKARLDEKNKQCVTARKKKADLQLTSPSYDCDYAKNFAHFCKDTKTFAINGTRVEISIQEINITELDGLIQSHNRKIEKLEDLKARAASNVWETRQLAQLVRRKINTQLASLNCCPYCAKDLNASDAHLDHIYPVSKGGLSLHAHLIFVCSSCNIKKRDSTLRTFIKETGLDEKAIHERLISLAKDF